MALPIELPRSVDSTNGRHVAFAVRRADPHHYLDRTL
jgi:hypothetical protein